MNKLKDIVQDILQKDWLQISSTIIRKKSIRREQISDLIPKSAFKYINDHQVYLKQNGGNTIFEKIKDKFDGTLPGVENVYTKGTTVKFK